MYKELLYAKKELNFIINKNNGEVTNKDIELKYNCDGNIIYAFIMQDKVTDELIGTFYDTKTAIVYDSSGILDKSGCNVIMKLFNRNKFNKIIKIDDGWYLCVY